MGGGRKERCGRTKRLLGARGAGAAFWCWCCFVLLALLLAALLMLLLLLPQPAMLVLELSRGTRPPLIFPFLTFLVLFESLEVFWGASGGLPGLPLEPLRSCGAVLKRAWAVLEFGGSYPNRSYVEKARER